MPKKTTSKCKEAKKKGGKKNQLSVSKDSNMDTCDSEATTLADTPPPQSSRRHNTTRDSNREHDESAPLEDTTQGMDQTQDGYVSDASSIEDEVRRDDMPVTKGRWSQLELDTLMTAVNVNRDALKFHFDGPGGGKDVKRQGWCDVADYVNDVANTNRTVKDCVSKTSRYTQKMKAKFNKLRMEVNKTGRGSINSKLKMTPTQQKALDYIRQEAVTGIPGIEPMPINTDDRPEPSEENKALLWRQDRPDKPDYSIVDMKRRGVPKNYNKNKTSKLARLQKQQRKKDHEMAMRQMRKRERAEAKAKKGEEDRSRDRNAERLQKTKREKDYYPKTQVEEARRSQLPYNLTAEEIDKKLKEKAERKKMRAAKRAEREARRSARCERELD